MPGGMVELAEVEEVVAVVVMMSRFNNTQLPTQTKTFVDITVYRYIIQKQQQKKRLPMRVLLQERAPVLSKDFLMIEEKSSSHSVIARLRLLCETS
jgi:hypothetical protein